MQNMEIRIEQEQGAVKTSAWTHAMKWLMMLPAVAAVLAFITSNDFLRDVLLQAANGTGQKPPV